MLEINKNVEGKKVTLQLTGMLDTSSAPKLDELLTAIYQDVDELELDFSGLEYISSAGLRVILVAQQTMSGKAGLTISHANEDVMEIFEATGFSDFLRFV